MLNRLKSSLSTGILMNEVLSYDDRGNVKTLKRDSDALITYTYANGNTSNRLASLSGGLTGSYTYDGNGNATKDRTGMLFTYNHLNLPKTAKKTGVSVDYRCDAAGAKLQKTATVGAVNTQTDYIGGIAYSKIGAAGSAIARIAFSRRHCEDERRSNLQVKNQSFVFIFKGIHELTSVGLTPSEKQNLF